MDADPTIARPYCGAVNRVPPARLGARARFAKPALAPRQN
jgi:hypothetical protein